MGDLNDRMRELFLEKCLYIATIVPNVLLALAWEILMFFFLLHTLCAEHFL